MRNELKHIEEIENYLTGKCTAEEKIAFEKRMQQDSDLKDDVSLQKNITERIALAAFVADVKSYNPDLTVTSSLTQSGSWFLNSIIAMVVTGAAVLGYLWYQNSIEENSDSNKFQTIASNKNQNNSDEISNVPLTNHTETPNGNSDSLPAIENFHFDHSNLTQYNSRGNSSHNLNTQTPNHSFDTDLLALNVDTDYSYQLGRNQHKSISNQVILKKLQVPFETIWMNAEVDKTFFTKASGSRVYIPGGIMVYEDGTPVKGEVAIKYREFRHPAEMAFADVPMSQNIDGKNYIFHSTGIIELRAVQKDREIKIADSKSYMLNLKPNQVIDTCSLKNYSEDNQNWKKINSISRREVADPANEEIIKTNTYLGAVTGTVIRSKDSAKVQISQNFYLEKNSLKIGEKRMKYYAQANDSGYTIQNIPNGRYTAHYISDVYRKMKIKGVKVKSGKYTQLDLVLGNNNITNEKWGHHLSKTPQNFPTKWDEETGSMISLYNTYLTSEIKYSPTKNNEGTSVADFGYFDQNKLTQASDQITIKGKFVTNIQEEISLNEESQLTVIDKNLNNAMRISPETFSVSASSSTTLLLISNGKIYMLSSEEFNKTCEGKSGSYTFQMKDITAQVNSVDDLKTLISTSK